VTDPGRSGQWPQQGHSQPSGFPYGPPPQYPTPGQQPFQPQQGHQWQPGAFAPPQSPQPPPSRTGSRRGLVIGLVVALVALVGGGATWLALSQSDSVTAGAATPTEAARNLAGSFGNGDVAGLLGTLAPAEAALFTDALEEATGELKRLQILDQDANPDALSGVQVQAAGLTFDEAGAERINDHLTITKLTGGKLTVTADLSRIPLAEDFVDAALSRQQRQELEQGPQMSTIDIGEQVRTTGEAIRIATVQVEGQWYPSLLYTVADYALKDSGRRWPDQSIPAVGAASPKEAVRQLAQAAMDADIRRVIELLPPDEMGVLHDAGPALLEAVGGDAEPTGFRIDALETENSEVAGGTRATITSLSVSDPAGEAFTLTKDGDCYRVSLQGRSRQLCADQVATMIEQEEGAIPPGAKQVVTNLMGGLLQQGVGVVTTEVDGKHYVSIVRTWTELSLTVLRSMRPEDVQTILRMAG
jgi:hypothetical protein